MLRTRTEEGWERLLLAALLADLNAYAKVEGQSGCCCPADDGNCCTPAETLHNERAALLARYDVNAAAASVKVYALKPETKACCGPACCPPADAV